MNLALHARALIATLWVGSLWTIGYLVAPTLFATLADRALAGTIAGSLFRIEAWVSLVCGLVLLLLVKMTVRLPAALYEGARQRRTLFLLIAGMLACTAISHLGLQPFMAELRAVSGGNLAGDAKTQFGILHGISSVLYLVQSLLGVALILKLR